MLKVIFCSCSVRRIAPGMEFSFPSLVSLFFISLCLVSKLVVCLQCYLSRLQERDVISLTTAPQPDPLDLETEKCGISEACRVWASGKITSPEPRMLEVHRILVNGTEVNWSKVGQPAQSRPFLAPRPTRSPVHAAWTTSMPTVRSPFFPAVTCSMNHVSHGGLSLGQWVLATRPARCAELRSMPTFDSSIKIKLTTR